MAPQLTLRQVPSAPMLAAWAGTPAAVGAGRGLSLESGPEGHRFHPRWSDTWIASASAVLRGLIEVRSPHLEELLMALFSAASALPAPRPVAVVSSLLLQEEEPPAAGQQDAAGSR